MLAASAPLIAQEAATPATAAAPEGSPAWLTAIWPILIAVLIPFAAKWMMSKSAEHKAKAEAASKEAEGIGQEIKNAFLDQRLIPFLYEAGAQIATTKLPEIITDAGDGGGFDWKKHLNDLKNELKELAIAKFKEEGTDIVKDLGDKYLDSLLERAILKAVPFLPNMLQKPAEGSAGSVADKVSNLVLDKGLDYAKKKWLDGLLD